MHRTALLSLLLLFLPIATPKPTPNSHNQVTRFTSNRPIVARKKNKGILDGSCYDSMHYPREEDFIWGYEDFCKNHLQRAYTIIREGHPVIFTYNLTAVDGAKVKWVFSNKVVHTVENVNQVLETNTKECLDRFGSLLDSNVVGGMGQSWCVVDGTGGDFFANITDLKGMRGQGQVMVWGGKIESGRRSEGWGGSLFGQWEWEARPKYGGS